MEEAPEEGRQSIPSLPGHTRSLGRVGMHVDVLFWVVNWDIIFLRSTSIRPVIIYQEFRVVHRRVLVDSYSNAVHMYCNTTVCVFSLGSHTPIYPSLRWKWKEWVSSAALGV